MRAPTALDLLRQVLAAEPAHLVCRRGERGDASLDSRRLREQLRQRELAGRRRSALPFRRAVVGVDEAGIVLSDGQHQPDVAIGECVHV